MKKVKVLLLAIFVLIFATSATEVTTQTKKTTPPKKVGTAKPKPTTPRLDVETLQALMAGNKSMLVMEKRGKKYSGGERLISLIVNASFEKCWRVVTDIESYKDFVPEMTESTVESKTENEIVAKFTIEVKFMAIGCTEKYSQKYILKKGEKVIEIVDPKTNVVGGTWKFISTSDGKTIILYQDKAPEVENMCWTAKMLVKMNPDAELALHSAPPFMFIASMKERIEIK